MIGGETINNYDVTAGKADVVQFAAGVAPSEVVVSRLSDNLILSITGTTDKLTVNNYFNADATGPYKVEQIKFADGTVWDVATVKAKSMVATEGTDFLYGTAGDDILNGLGGSDVIYGGAGNDTLDGGLGNDALSGDAGNDTYLFGKGSGQDVITNYDITAGKVDVVQFVSGVAPSEVVVSRSYDNLILSITGATDTLTITNYFGADATGPYKVEQIKFADGTSWGVTAVKAMALSGTAGNDTLYGYATSDALSGLAGNDLIYGRVGDDLIDGGAGADTLYGEDGNDTMNGGGDNDVLYGGNGNDTLDGGLGNDTLSGDAGNDIYLFGKGAGLDTINNYDTTAGKVDVVQFVSGVAPTEVVASRLSDNLILSITGTTDKLTINNYFNTDAAGPYKVEQIKFADGTVWDVTAVKAKVLVATEGADNLYGYATNDTLNGLGGNDFIDGRAGDDLIDGGTGADTLYGVDGNDTMNGGADNDVLYGGNGIDTLNGGTGNDTLSGGLGSDVYLFGRSSGADLLSDYDAAAGNTDRLDIGAGVDTDQIWFRRVGSDLEMSIIGTGDKTTISGWYYGAAYHVEQFKTADGKMLLDSQVDALVTAMAGFAPPAAGQTTLPLDYQTALNPVIAANWK